jgi:hypothetical protein
MPMLAAHARGVLPNSTVPLVFDGARSLASDGRGFSCLVISSMASQPALLQGEAAEIRER